MAIENSKIISLSDYYETTWKCVKHTQGGKSLEAYSLLRLKHEKIEALKTSEEN